MAIRPKGLPFDIRLQYYCRGQQGKSKIRIEKVCMKRPRQHSLEYESRLALRSLLPSEWIVRDKDPDYGIDMEVEIVEAGEVTNNVLWLQIKATETAKLHSGILSCHIRTANLKYYQGCSIPVVILYYIKQQEAFYCVFVQKYITEELCAVKPQWRERQTATVRFPQDSKLEDIGHLRSIAIEGRFYIIQQQLGAREGSAQYWLDGIPESDNVELKERTLKGLEYSRVGNYRAAIAEFEDILRVCTISPTEKIATLLSLGNSHMSMSNWDASLKNYEAVLVLVGKVDEAHGLEAKANALGNIGLIYRFTIELDEALKYHQIALALHREISDKLSEASGLGNMGLIYRAKGDFDEALKYHHAGLKIHRKIGSKQGEANQLGNIGLVYIMTRDLDKALKYSQEALILQREIGDKQGEANQLCNIGVVYRIKKNLNDALKFFLDGLKIHREVGDRQGEANDLSNIGLVHRDNCDLDDALKYLKETLEITREIGDRYTEALTLGYIGLVYLDQGNLDDARKYLQEATERLTRYGAQHDIEAFQKALEVISTI